MSDLRARADALFEEALRVTGARDPRDFYRQQLRELRDSAPEAYTAAVRHFEEILLPSIAQEGADPLDSWLEYGRTLAQLRSPGESVQIDPTGRATPFRTPVPLANLALHLPASSRDPVLVIGIPPRLSTAQRATWDLLVRNPSR